MIVENNKIGLSLFLSVILALNTGCGLNTPAKDVFVDDRPDKAGFTPGGDYETSIVNHVTCEITQGLRESERLKLPWVREWGTTVTQSITVEDQGGVAPGVTFTDPLRSAIYYGSPITQYFSFSVGVTASANALRTETIQYTFRNADLLNKIPESSCREVNSGFLVDGDLRIREFIYDKALVAKLGNPSLGEGGPYAKAYNTFTEEITFVATLGGSVTPTWKLARVSANTGSNLLIGQRTNTNDLIITLGPLAKQAKNAPVQLTKDASDQHFARVQANAIAVAVQGQQH